MHSYKLHFPLNLLKLYIKYVVKRNTDKDIMLYVFNKFLDKLLGYEDKTSIITLYSIL